MYNLEFDIMPRNLMCAVQEGMFSTGVDAENVGGEEEE
jgi:hypothetical protein